MNWISLHHPDICLPVIRRKTADELLMLLAGTATLVLTRGASCVYSGLYASTDAYQSALRRLKKNGFLAQQQTDGSLPKLSLAPAAYDRLPNYLHPERHWNKRWNKWWYILMFDVPEAQRQYRDTLRSFLKKKYFGCLQKSVWVTPIDVRSEYKDLDQGAAVDSVAFLFEARTVLGYGNQSVVQEAWNFEELHTIQELYIQTARKNIERLKDRCAHRHQLLELLRIDNHSYSQAMMMDPLLPKELHPKDYLGRDAFLIHKHLTQEIMTQSKNRNIISRS